MDITDQASIEHAKNQVNHAIGDAGLDGLVNNAGVVYISPLEFVPLDELRWLFEVNFFGLLAVTAFVLAPQEPAPRAWLVITRVPVSRPMPINSSTM